MNYDGLMSDDDDDLDDPTSHAPAVEIPFRALSADALAGVIAAFVLREGTDYGAEETGHAAKTAQVRRQLEKGEAVIVFDPGSRSVTLLTREEHRRLQRAADST